MLESSSVGILTAFVAGLVSFLSPCVLPLVPGYISYVSGQSLGGNQGQAATAARLSVFIVSVFFVLGFSTVFVALGASATTLGQLLLSYRYEANIIGGVIVILFGLFLTGLFNFSWMQRDLRFHTNIKGGRPLGAYVLGLAFAFGWTPCIGPVLGAILTVSAVSPAMSSGVALLSVYSLGLGVPFLLAAIFTGAFMDRLKAMRRIGRALQIGAGVVLIIMGIAMITGQLSVFAYWLLKTFPGLATIG
ncbi:MAG: cytochrome c biogenesis protein CcdA [Gammaproteobacteria bacterium]|jgi:cytochrome c-type biogenesis protein|nr:cytochrome c biogenesis protein CcdA [Gammaproteobacteria bacterium]